MSQISDIYDSINTFLDASYDASGRALTNPYSIEENDDITLKRGYGFYMGTGRDQGTMGNMIALEREMVVTLTLETAALEHKNGKRMTAEKQLLEDAALMVKALHNDPAVNEKVSGIIYQSDNGIEFIYGEKTNFIMIQSRFLITYIEQ